MRRRYRFRFCPGCQRFHWLRFLQEKMSAIDKLACDKTGSGRDENTAPTRREAIWLAREGPR